MIHISFISMQDSQQYNIFIFKDMNQQHRPKIRVIVIGAGLSGLTAARELLNQDKFQVVVLEANDYVGGRTKSIMLNNTVFDLGAQFIGPTQRHAIELCLESKNELIPVSNKGRKIIDLKEGNYSYTGDIPNIGNILALIETKYMMMKLNRIARKINPKNPGDSPMAHKWDQMTAQTWIENNLTSMKTRVMFEGAIRVILGVELSEISFLYVLNYITQSKDVQNLISVQNGLQEKKTSKGTQHMSIFLSQEIKKKGGNIQLNFFVKNVQQMEDKVIVTNTKGEKVEGNYLIIAMPPPNVTKIDFHPPLSVQRRMICERAFMGAIAKVLVLYPQAYWKNKGFSGEVLSDCYDGPAMNVFDDTRQNAEKKVQPALCVFVGGGVYKYWKERPDFEKLIVQKLAEYFKEPKMLHPTEVKWNPWEDQTSMGGPVGNFPPGVLSQIDDLRMPEGRIHWAGTEMATESVGFMDGAIQSGKRVAREIKRLLQQGQSCPLQLSKKLQKQAPSYTKYNQPPKISLINHVFQWW